MLIYLYLQKFFNRFLTHNKMKKLFAAMMLVSAMGLYSCGNANQENDVQEEASEMINEMDESMEDAADEAGEVMEDAAESADSTMQEAGDAVKDATN
jgi:hypothetical protein